MPELPEVESFRKYVEDTSLHQRIVEARSSASGMLIGTTEKELREVLKGNSLEGTYRRGKFLFIKLKSGDSLMLHFGMTGDLLYYTPDKQKPRTYVLLLEFSSGKHLLFSDPRRLGKIAIVTDVDEFIRTRGYGEDALSISQKDFVTRVKKRKAAIKTVLMNQKVIAGVGNEFSDEILFQSHIHPESPANKVPEPKLVEVYEHIISILREAVKHNADREKLTHYFFLGNRRAGLKCPGNCKGLTEFKTIGGRSAYFCSSCQKLYR
jgi:formamidopyrimidine-DNA glycosylase